MKNIKLSIPAFLNPRLSFLSKVYALVYRLELLMIALLTLTIFASQKFYATNTPEASVFFFNIQMLFICLALFFLRYILKRKEHFVDPVGFIPVLLFALLTTFSAVMVLQPNAANTFGTDSVKMLTGLSTILFVFLYYFIHFKAKYSPSLPGRLMRYIALSSFVVILSIVLAGISTQTIQDLTLAVRACLFVLPILLILVIKKGSFALIELIALAANVLFLFQQRAIIQKDSQFMTIWILAILITSLIALIVLFKNRNNPFRTYGSELKHDFNLIWKDAVEGVTVSWSRMYALKIKGVKFLLLFVPVIFAGIIIYLLSANQLQPILKNVATQYELIPSLVNNISAQIIFFGKGVTSVATDSSFIISIFKAQGLFGIIGYITLFGYALFLAIQNIGLYIRKQTPELYVALASLFIIIFTLVTAVITYVPFVYGILFWIAFAISCLFSKYSITNSQILDYKLEDLSIKNKNITIARNILFLVFLIICIIGYFNLNSVQSLL